ncbi:hypothetical protein M9H77_33996 [Catharanthus roseus]|uniref:Uncharacterized protein n=1 Tax=Catharanthus roseus TaxID=4058 RepID=A0ACB9ZJW7_CATRO|nr:hypothetical protein M9H77_33996 [Catharanthus roseus]
MSNLYIAQSGGHPSKSSQLRPDENSLDVVARTRNSDWRSDHNTEDCIPATKNPLDGKFSSIPCPLENSSPYLGMLQNIVVTPSIAKPLATLSLLHSVFGVRVDRIFRILGRIELSFFRVIVIVRFKLTRNSIISVGPVNLIIIIV